MPVTIRLVDGHWLLQDGQVATSESCCCACNCENITEKIWITFDNVQKGVGVCGEAQWIHCEVFDPGLRAVAASSVAVGYYPQPPDTPTALRVTLSSGGSSFDNCVYTAGPSIGRGKTWIYEYALDDNNCPTGEPTLVDEYEADNRYLCDEPGECCDETCIDISYTPSLSLLP